MTDVFHIRLKRRERQVIDELVKKGQFESISDFIHEAVSHHIRYHEERLFREYMMAHEGKTPSEEAIGHEAPPEKD